MPANELLGARNQATSVLRPGLVGSRADQNMPDALLSHFEIPWGSRKECVDFSLLQKRNLIIPIWHRDPVDIFLGVQTDVCHKHRDEDFRIDNTADHLLTFEVTRGTNVLARDQFYAAVMGGRQDHEGRARIDESDVARGERKRDVCFPGKKSLLRPTLRVSCSSHTPLRSM